MTIEEAIMKFGKLHLPDFNFDEPGMQKIYYTVLGHMNLALNEKAKNAKGIFLIGNMGVGKSVCMRVMGSLYKDTHRYFQFAKTRDIAKELEWRNPSDILYDFGYELKRDLYLDDIGLAQSVRNDYGNKVNIIAELLMERYDLFVREGFKTHMSSNRMLNVDRSKYPDYPPTVLDLYGDVVLDRIKEMNTIIVWKGTSLRTLTEIRS